MCRREDRVGAMPVSLCPQYCGKQTEVLKVGLDLTRFQRVERKRNTVHTLSYQLSPRPDVKSLTKAPVHFPALLPSALTGVC